MTDTGAYVVTFGEDWLSGQEAGQLGMHLQVLGDKAKVLNMLLAEKIPLNTVKKIESHL